MLRWFKASVVSGALWAVSGADIEVLNSLCEHKQLKIKKRISVHTFVSSHNGAVQKTKHRDEDVCSTHNIIQMVTAA